MLFSLDVDSVKLSRLFQNVSYVEVVLVCFQMLHSVLKLFLLVCEGVNRFSVV